jgi:hypothetical protein
MFSVRETVPCFFEDSQRNFNTNTHAQEVITADLCLSCLELSVLSVDPS